MTQAKKNISAAPINGPIITSQWKLDLMNTTWDRQNTSIHIRTYDDQHFWTEGRKQEADFVERKRMNFSFDKKNNACTAVANKSWPALLPTMADRRCNSSNKHSPRLMQAKTSPCQSILQCCRFPWCSECSTHTENTVFEKCEKTTYIKVAYATP